FDVDALAAIRVEDPQVFAAVHEMLLAFVAKRWGTALRIDHASGLLDPQQYLADLERAVRIALGEESNIAQDPARLLYTLVEKILAHHESLPADLPAPGPAGDDFL